MKAIISILCTIGLILLVRYLITTNHHFWAMITVIMGFSIIVEVFGGGGSGGDSCDCAGTPGCM